MKLRLFRHGKLIAEADGNRIGLGDVIEAVAKPIAKVLNLDCLDKETGQLKASSDCAKRRDKANKIEIVKEENREQKPPV